MSAFEKFAENQMAATFRLPDMVKKADEAVLTPPHKAGAFYADPVALEYACHNAPATLFSTAMLLFHGKEKNAKFTAILDRLEKSATHFGVHAEFADLNEQDKKARDIAQEKLADDQFAMVTVFEGQTIRQYPIRNKDEVKAAAEFLKRNRSNFRFEDRNKIARRISAKAQELEVGEVVGDEIILKTAGLALVNGKTLGDVLRKMAALAGSEEKDRAIKMADIFDKFTLVDNNSAVKTASVLDDFFSKTGAKIDPIEDRIFVVTKKDLEQVKQSFVAFGGEFFSKDHICKLGKDKAVGLIGERATCLFSIIPIKPSADDEKYAAVLSQALKTAGIS